MSDADRPAPRAVIDLEEFMRVLPHLDSGELMAISAAYHDADADARVAARAAASAAARKRNLLDELGHVQGSIIQWAGSDISRAGAFTFADVRPDQMLGDIRVQAVPPLLDAATALLLGDALDPAARDALLEPWASADA
jgi:hypothetical protein